MAAKLYVIVRQDLDHPVRMVQACHAALDFAVRYPDETAWWSHRSNHLAVLGAADGEALEKVLRDADRAGLKAVPFHEPDMPGAPMTAVAVQPGEAAKRLLRGLRLSR